MNKFRIVIIEGEGLDPDAEFGLVRTLRDLLERPSSAAPAAVVPSAESAPEPKPEPEHVRASPAKPARDARRIRTQEEIEDHVVDALTRNSDVSLEKLQEWAYGADDKRRAMKLTLTLKRLAARGIVERLDKGSWRVLSAAEREPDEEESRGRGGDEDDDGLESNGQPEDDDEPQELEL